MARQELGVCLSPTNGWFSGGSIGADGKYENNVITFPGTSMVFSQSKKNNGGWYYCDSPSAPKGVQFTITITPGGTPQKPASIGTVPMSVNETKSVDLNMNQTSIISESKRITTVNKSEKKTSFKPVHRATIMK